MSDLLSRMIDRAARGGAAPEVEPILASRYEPPVVGGTDGPVAEASVSLKQSAMDRARTAGADAGEVAQMESFDDPTPRPSLRLLREPFLKQRRGPAATPAIAPQELANDLGGSPRERGEMPGSSRTGQPAGPDVRVHTREMTTRAEASTRLIETRETPVEDRAAEPATIALNSDSEDRPAFTGVRAEPAAVPPVEVQVTIGHIEVRTAPAPVAQQQPYQRRSPRPGVTLDEYLRRRNGGSR